MMKESAAELRAVRCKRFKQSTHFRYHGVLLDGLRRTAGILAKIFTEVQYYEYNEIDRGVRP
jgi:hypothetical protein